MDIDREIDINGVIRQTWEYRGQTLFYYTRDGRGYIDSYSRRRLSPINRLCLKSPATPLVFLGGHSMQGVKLASHNEIVVAIEDWICNISINTTDSSIDYDIFTTFDGEPIVSIAATHKHAPSRVRQCLNIIGPHILINNHLHYIVGWRYCLPPPQTTWPRADLLIATYPAARVAALFRGAKQLLTAGDIIYDGESTESVMIERENHYITSRLPPKLRMNVMNGDIYIHANYQAETYYAIVDRHHKSWDMLKLVDYAELIAGIPCPGKTLALLTGDTGRPQLTINVTTRETTAKYTHDFLGGPRG